MAATVVVKELNGAGAGTPTAVTNVRLCTADDYNPGTTNTMLKPSAGTNNSYWKTIYLNADTSPTGTINNVKFHTDGTIGWTGVTLYAGTDAAYTEATGTPGDTGDVSAVATVDAATYTAGSPLSVTGSINNPATGRITDYVILQLELSTSAATGALSAETITWKYDET